MSFLSNISPIRIAQAVVSPGAAVVGAIADHVTAPAPKPEAPPALPEMKPMPNGTLPPARPADDKRFDASVKAAQAKASEIWHPPLTADANKGEAMAGGEKRIDLEGRNVSAEGADILAPDAARDEKAVLEVYANRELEKAAFAKLEPEQQKAYKDLEALFDADPQAHLALQMSLLNGKADAIVALDKLSKTEVQPPMNAGALSAEACREIADPSQIKQRDPNTCGVASLQVQMAAERPAEYVRILTGLAAKGNHGVALADGKSKVTRPPGAEDPDGTGRTSSSRLWQGSFMNFAANASSPGSRYDPKTDTVTWTNGMAPSRGGMDVAGVAGTRKAVLGEQVMTSLKHFEDRDQAIMGLRQGGEVMVATAYKPDGSPAKVEKLTIKEVRGSDFFLVDAKGQPYPKIAKGEQPVGVSYAEMHARLEASPGYDRKQAVDAMMAQLQDDVKNKQSSAVSLRWGEFDAGSGQFGVPIGTPNQVDPKHFVTVTNIDDKRVYYRNSQGSEESMDLETFRARLDGTITTGAKV